MALKDLSPVLRRSLLNTIDRGEQEVPVNITNQLTRTGLDVAGEIVIKAAENDMEMTDEEMDTIADDYFDRLFTGLEDDSIDLFNPRDGTSTSSSFKATGSAGFAARYKDKANRPISAINLTRLLNAGLDKYMRLAMNPGGLVENTLTYRTGRFSNSVRVEELKSGKLTDSAGNQRAKGTTSLYFNYMVAPYSVFDPAISTNQRANYSDSYNPRLIIRAAIDEALRDILHSDVFKTEVFRKYMR